MIMTMLEASVNSKKGDGLQKSFDSGSAKLPPEILQSWLIQDTNNNREWRMVTLWKSSEALENYRQSVDTPGGILMFRDAGVEPHVSIFKIQAHAEAD
jgi:hypothetical protein